MNNCTSRFYVGKTYGVTDCIDEAGHAGNHMDSCGIEWEDEHAVKTKTAS